MARTYLTFGDLEGKLDVLRVECTARDRKRRYNAAKLIEKHGRHGNMMKWKEQLNGDCRWTLPADKVAAARTRARASVQIAPRLQGIGQLLGSALLLFLTCKLKFFGPLLTQLDQRSAELGDLGLQAIDPVELLVRKLDHAIDDEIDCLAYRPHAFAKRVL